VEGKLNDHAARGWNWWPGEGRYSRVRARPTDSGGTASQVDLGNVPKDFREPIKASMIYSDKSHPLC
jgi:hypothetical protein